MNKLVRKTIINRMFKYHSQIVRALNFLDVRRLVLPNFSSKNRCSLLIITTK